MGGILCVFHSGICRVNVDTGTATDESTNVRKEHVLRTCDYLRPANGEKSSLDLFHYLAVDQNPNGKMSSSRVGPHQVIPF